MPRYDYKCVECGEIQEVVHGMDENPEVTCEANKRPRPPLIAKKMSQDDPPDRVCGGECVRVLNPTNFQFNCPMPTA